ncbi:MAG: hypothetical protein JWM93_3142 [Frankiales bacterium]|nr:hypothetical protein [Frankiales bacterium]
MRFGEGPKADGAWAGRRLLFVEDQPAFELSFWCGTCQLLFRRLAGANQTGSLDQLADRLATGVRHLDDDIISAFAALLPRGEYIPLLLEVQPQLAMPAGSSDYFAQEQIGTWGLESFWGLPTYPATPYYRTFETVVDHRAHLYEFVVPMVPPSWNNEARVRDFVDALSASNYPTAVAVSTLDVCQPADAGPGDYYAHWGLTHFLLDGHHKMQAAASVNRPLRLLTLLSMSASLATPEQVMAVPRLRASPLQRRVNNRAPDAS